MGIWRKRGGLSAAFCEAELANIRPRRISTPLAPGFLEFEAPNLSGIRQRLPGDGVQSRMIQMNIVHNFRQGRQLQIPERAEIEDTKTWKQVLIDKPIATIFSVNIQRVVR